MQVQKKKKKVHYLFVVRATRSAAQPLFHQVTQSVHGSIHNGLAAASTCVVVRNADFS